MSIHTRHSEHPVVPVATLREFRRISVYAWLVLIFAALCLGGVWSWIAALQWILQAGLLWVLVMHKTRTHLPLNYNDTTRIPHPHLGLANRLTILRGWLIACTGGFLFQPLPPGLLVLVPAGLYAVSAIVDRLDGYAARKTGQVSRMGMELDTVFDALGLAVAPLLAVWLGKIHWSYLLVSCAYYLLQWGISYRHKAGLPVVALQPKLSRRAIAGFQMGFIAVVLFPIFEPPVTWIAGIAFMLPVLAGFLLDWLAVSGKIVKNSYVNQEMLELGESVIHCGSQPLLRLILVGMLLTAVLQHSGNISTIMHATPLLLYAVVACCGLILMGILGRIFALILVLLLGWYYTTHLMGPLDYVILPVAIWVMILGTGRFSAYSWDDAWVNRYDGA
ncbi:MAG: CDP-alcohol phosphatidyltransferase family protein [Desulfuromonadaceae bacterium]|nr:CDP-alcohol phosphatidyltransferase family protein [Desulfuromonadaceae bacterium]